MARTEVGFGRVGFGEVWSDKARTEVWYGWVRLGKVGCGTVWYGEAGTEVRSGSVRLGEVRCGQVRFGRDSGKENIGPVKNSRPAAGATATHSHKRKRRGGERFVILLIGRRWVVEPDRPERRPFFKLNKLTQWKQING
jgi:hypothetical protein